MNYGEILKKIRLSKNLTQNEVANYLGISQVTYSHYEVQEKIIPLERLNALSNYYNISIDYMLGFTLNKSYNNFNYEIDKVLVGNKLKEFRKENRMTQKKLAEILNTVHQVVSKFENGTNLIATPFLYTICKKYNISADYLLGKVKGPKYFK